MDIKIPRGTPEEIDTMAGETVARFLKQVEERMRARMMTRAELARRMGISRAAVTKIFSGSSNMTVRTMTAIADAIHHDLILEVQRRRASYPHGMKFTLKKPRKK
jgi:transcriptional regulator with XRE-family HTH domain